MDIQLGVHVCDGSTVDDLPTVATGNNLQFYSDAVNGSALDGTDLLVAGDYYVSNTENGCESDRTLFSVNLILVTFTAPADLCIDAGVQAGLSGGTTSGGVYSGTGITDDGNGTTYSFDPAAAGVGTHRITYIDGCGNSAGGWAL
jgi:hypothetical protein